MTAWEGLNPPYATIVADPPWHYEQGGPHSLRPGKHGMNVPPYSTMTVDDVVAMPVAEIARPSAHLYLWTTNAYLEAAYDIARSWSFRPSQLLTWCKPTKGLGPGGAFANTTEFCLFARRNCAHRQRMDSTSTWSSRYRPAPTWSCSPVSHGSGGTTGGHGYESGAA